MTQGQQVRALYLVARVSGSGGGGAKHLHSRRKHDISYRIPIQLRTFSEFKGTGHVVRIL